MNGTLQMALVLVVVMLAIGLWVRIANNPTGGLAVTSNTYLKNVFVNGVELAGMTYEQGLAAMEQVVQQRMNTPITLVYQGKQWPIAPKDLDAKMDYSGDMAQAFNYGHIGSAKQIREHVEYLKTTPHHIDTPLQYDAARLDAFIAMVKSEVDTPYIDALITMKANEIFDIEPSVNGYQLNADELKNQITACIVEGATPTIQLVPDIWAPHLTTEKAQLITTTKLAEGTTSLKGSNDDRVANVKRALEPFRAMAVAPGEQVSFNKVVGKRTKANRFKEAQEFLDGQVTTGVGGGTCQASTALYKPLVEAGFQIDQRYEHSMTVAYVRAGYDATVTDDGRKDLVFTNISEYPMYIYAYCDSTQTRVVIYGMPLPYTIKFMIKDIETHVQAKSYTPKKDTQHRYVHNPGDPPVEYKPGRPGGSCEGWVYYYDLEDPTKEVLPAVRIARSTYEPMKPIMWVYAD